MEEDVEIEILYKTHSQFLMETAAKEDYPDKEEDSKKDTENSEVQSFINNKVFDFITMKSKRKREQKFSKRKRAKCTDFEDLINCEAVKYLVKKCEKGLEEDSDDDLTVKEVVDKILGNNSSSDKRLIEVEKSQLVETIKRAKEELENIIKVCENQKNKLKLYENKLIELLNGNANKRRLMQDQLNSKQFVKDKKLTNRTNKSVFKKFGKPYLWDKNKFPFPPSEDVKIKKKTGMLYGRFTPKIKSWTESNKVALQDAIHATLKKENCERLVKELNKLKDMLGRATDEQTEIEIQNSIEKLQDRLEKTKCMSYLDLLANEDPNREYDWLKYSAKDFNGAHSDEDCKQFWHLYLKPTINKSIWKESEDRQLIELVTEKGIQDWDLIAKTLGTDRSGYQVFIHYKNRLCNKLEFSKGKWTKKEDEKLLQVINSARVGGFIPWTKVASYMDGRTHNQIYNRYQNCLNPKLVKGKFRPEEDLLIVSGIEVFRVTYQELSAFMNHRTVNQIRERYERHLLPDTSKIGTFSVEEDELLLKLIDKHGVGNFSTIAKIMKTRSRTQIRQRYNAIMKIKKTNPDWTPDSCKRRSLNKVTKCRTKTQKQVLQIRKKMEKILGTFSFDELENKTFRLEKLKELQDLLTIEKLNLKPIKKKSISDNSEVNVQLLEYFRNNNEKNPTSLKIKSSGDRAAYLNEILLLARYFGHDLELPKSKKEIMENKMLSLNMRSFLIENLKQRTVRADSIKQSSVNSTFSPQTEANNIDYVEPDFNDTLLMEDKWHNAVTDISKLNFSEFLKRTVFDYSNGMHKDIWEAKMKRSKVPELTFSIDERPSSDQLFFIPPNSVTTLGLKSIFLSRQRLRRDAKNKTDIDANNVTSPLMYRFQDKFMDTLMSLFFCPKVLTLTDISETSIYLGNKGSSQESTFCREIVDPEENSIDIVVNENRPIDEGALEARKKKIKILEQKKREFHNLLHFNKGLAFKRKMQIEHLLTKFKHEPLELKKEGKTFSSCVPKKLKNKSSCSETTTSSEKPCEQINKNGVNVGDPARISQKKIENVLEVSSDKLTVNSLNEQIHLNKTQWCLRSNANPKKPLPSDEDSNGPNSGITTSQCEPNHWTRGTAKSQSIVNHQ